MQLGTSQPAWCRGGAEIGYQNLGCLPSGLELPTCTNPRMPLEAILCLWANIRDSTNVSKHSCLHWFVCFDLGWWGGYAKKLGSNWVGGWMKSFCSTLNKDPGVEVPGKYSYLKQLSMEPLTEHQYFGWLIPLPAGATIPT